MKKLSKKFLELFATPDPINMPANRHERRMRASIARRQKSIRKKRK